MLRTNCGQNQDSHTSREIEKKYNKNHPQHACQEIPWTCTRMVPTDESQLLSQSGSLRARYQACNWLNRPQDSPVLVVTSKDVRGATTPLQHCPLISLAEIVAGNTGFKKGCKFQTPVRGTCWCKGDLLVLVFFLALVDIIVIKTIVVTCYCFRILCYMMTIYKLLAFTVCA